MATGGSEEERVLTILWKIENIGLAERRPLWSGITSPVFRARNLEAKLFHLGLKPKEGMDKQLTLNFHLLENPLKFPIDCEWSFIGSDESPVVSGTMRKLVMKRKKSFRMSGCPTHEEVFFSRKSDFLTNDALTVRLRIWRSDGDFSKKELVSSLTKFEPIEHSFLWPIEELRALQMYGELLTPVKFGDGGPDTFLMKLTMKGDSLEESRGNIELTPVSIGSSLSATMNIYLPESDQNILKRMVTNSGKVLENNQVTGTLPESLTGNELLRKKSNSLENDFRNLREIRTTWYTEGIERYFYGKSDQEADFLI